MSRERDEAALVEALAPMTYNGVVDDTLGDVVQAVLNAGFHRTEEPAHEWKCPGCGATTRARLADYGTPRTVIAEQVDAALRLIKHERPQAAACTLRGVCIYSTEPDAPRDPDCYATVHDSGE